MIGNIGVGGLVLARISDLASAIAGLFRNNEPGVWYDPSDFSTMYQDAAGTIPVTGPEQPVGLILDKSQRSYLGPNIMINGDVATSAGWITGAGRSANTGALVWDGTSGGTIYRNDSGATEGKWYEMTFTITSISAGTIRANVGGNYGPDRTTPGTYTQRVQFGSTPLVMGVFGASAPVAQVDNIEVREVIPYTDFRGPELVPDPEFNNPGAWSVLATAPAVAPTIVNGTAIFNSPEGSYTSVRATGLAMRPGALYEIIVNVKEHTAGTFQMALVGGTIIAKSGITSAGVKRWIITNTNNTAIEVSRASGTEFNAVIESISVREILGTPASQATAASRPKLRGEPATFSANLVQNPEFNTNTNSWSVLYGTQQRVMLNGSWQLRLTADGSGGVAEPVRAYQYLATEPGEVYEFTASLTGELDEASVTINLNGLVGPNAGIMTLADGGFTASAYHVFRATGAVTTVVLMGTDVPGDTASFDNISVRKITSFSRYYLDFDGVDDWLSTVSSLDLSSSDKVSIHAGMHKLSDTTIGIVAELSPSSDANNGSFRLAAPGNTGTANYAVVARGTTGGYTSSPLAAAPDTAVISATVNLSGDRCEVRRNGVASAAGGSDLGTGAFGTYLLYLGRRGGASLPFRGRLYGLVIRGALSDQGQINSSESYMNSKTGAY